MMMFLRSALFNLWYAVITIVTSLVFLPLIWHRPTAFLAARLWSRITGFGLRVICGVHVRVDGREHLHHPGAIYASQHQSAWETIYFFELFERYCVVLKRELLNIPLVGWYMRAAGMIAIDRKAGAGAMKQLLKDAKIRHAQGHQIVIFPEGTRMRTGMRGALQPGVMALYRYLNAPIVPITLNSGTVWPRNSFFKTPGTIVCTLHPPIPPGLSQEELFARLEQLYYN